MASDARFADVKRMLESADYRLDRTRGSHHVFVKAGEPIVVVPVHRGKVKPFYVRKVKKLVEED